MLKNYQLFNNLLIVKLIGLNFKQYRAQAAEKFVKLKASKIYGHHLICNLFISIGSVDNQVYAFTS